MRNPANRRTREQRPQPDALAAARGAMVSGEFSSPALAQAEDEGYVVLRKPLDPAILQALLARWMASGVIS